MRFRFWSKLNSVDAMVVVLCVAAYGHALCTTAIDGFWTGPDFDHPPMSGFSCLLTGWLFYPLEWLANPALLAAVVLLLTRHRVSACFAGMLALGLAYLWTQQFQREFSADLLMQGYYSWLISMEILAVGSISSAAIHYGRRFAPRKGRA